MHLPKNKEKLQIFSEKAVTKPRYNTLEKEKLVSKCLKQHLVWCHTNQLKPPTAKQCIELPPALAKADGMPHKGNNSVITTVLENRRTKGKLCSTSFLKDGYQTLSFLRACSSFTQHLCPHTPTCGTTPSFCCSNLLLRILSSTLQKFM